LKKTLEYFWHSLKWPW